MDKEIEVFGLPGGEPVVLVPYDSRWPDQFEVWRALLVAELTDAAVEHVGSTAVPGLVAKPVIDVQVSVADVTDETMYRAAIECTGLVLRAREPMHRFFRPDVAAGARRDVHVHVCSRGSSWERSHLLFRDYLRAHHQQREAYARLKHDLAARLDQDRLAYTDGKDRFVAETLELAEDWARERGWRP